MKRRIQIHWSFIILSIAMIAAGHAKTLITLVVSVTLHELAHITVLKIYGGRVKNLRFMALGEVAVVKGLEEMEKWRRCVIFLSGPLFSIFIGACAFIFGWENISSLNFLIGFFNLIPVFPLDGGRVMQLILGNKIGILRGDRLITRFGRMLGYAVMLAGIIYAVLYPCDISLLCVGMYIKQWNKRILIPLTLEFFNMLAKKTEIKKGVVPVRLCAVYSDTPLRFFVERVNWDFFTHALVDNRPQDLLREEEVMNYVFENGLYGTVGMMRERLNL